MICNVCQCCGNLIIDKNKFGTNLDKTTNFDYCSYCYTDGRLIHNVMFKKDEVKNIEINFY